jgi:RimJ/RimL family protein N-acetyltransferase
VEIAYFTRSDLEGRGHAGRTAVALVALARAADPAPAIWAKTLPEENASTHILRRLGFGFTGIVQDHEIGDAWRWQLQPPA